MFRVSMLTNNRTDPLWCFGCFLTCVVMRKLHIVPLVMRNFVILQMLGPMFMKMSNFADGLHERINVVEEVQMDGCLKTFTTSYNGKLIG